MQLGNLVADAAAANTARNLFPSFVSDVIAHHNTLTEQKHVAEVVLYALGNVTVSSFVDS